MTLKIKEWEEYKAAHPKPKVEVPEPTYYVKIKLGYFTIPFNLIILLGIWKLIELIIWVI
jgi:hypothetical protein